MLHRPLASNSRSASKGSITPRSPLHVRASTSSSRCYGSTRCSSTSSLPAHSTTSKRVVCHAGRPMWARGTPEPDDGNRGGGMSAMITKDITSCDSVPELETVFIEHSGSFTFINAAAAITKYAKLPGSHMRSPFFGKLAAVWLSRLSDSDSGSQGFANVLWACSKLGSAEHPVWAQTWQAFLGFVQKDLNEGQSPSVQPQQLANVLYACAKLRQQPQPDELLLLLDAFVHPVALAAAKPQEIANVIWSLGLLNNMPGWQAQVSQELQQLLAPQLLAKVATEGTDQNVANVLVGLGRMCIGQSPLLSTAAAQGYAEQLLAGIRLKSLSTWMPQHITNIMWALGELQLENSKFIQAAVAAAPVWLSKSTAFNLTQAATACAQLKYRDEHFMGLLLQRVEQMLQPNRSGRGRSLSDEDRASIAAMCSLSVVLLDMRGLAGQARKLVADSNIKQQGRTHPSSLRRLWVFHSWLLKHQLLDGKGLEGLVTQQQLQKGAKEAAAWGDKTRL